MCVCVVVNQANSWLACSLLLLDLLIVFVFFIRFNLALELEICFSFLFSNLNINLTASKMAYSSYRMDWYFVYSFVCLSRWKMFLHYAAPIGMHRIFILALICQRIFFCLDIWFGFTALFVRRHRRLPFIKIQTPTIPPANMNNFGWRY